MKGHFKSFSKKLVYLKKRAKRKGITFDLDHKWMTTKFEKGYCEATGLKLNYSKEPFINPYYPSIDRIDSNKGYTKDNCKVVCHMYNSAKCEFSEKVFKTWAKAYVKNYEDRIGKGTL